MDNIFDNIFNWIDNNEAKSKFNLTASGMERNIFINSGIDFSKEEFAKKGPSAETDLYQMISEIYGVESNEIMSTNGGSEAIQIASLFLARESERINVPVPEYEPMYLVPERYMFKVRRIGEKENFSLKKNESLSFTDPNNPTGDLASKKDPYREAMENNLTYCDETFLEFRFPQKPETSFVKYENSITSTTFTKFYGTGFLRIGYMFASRERIAKLKEYRRLSSGSVNYFSLYMAAKILERRSYFVREVKNIIERNRNIVKSKLSKAGFDFSSPDNSSTTFVRGEYSYEWCQRLRDEKGVLVIPGRYFGVEKGFRICFTTSPEIISEALDIIGEFKGE